MKNKHHQLTLLSIGMIIFIAAALLIACQTSHVETTAPVPTASSQAFPSPSPVPTLAEHSGPIYYVDCSAAINGNGSQEFPWNTVKTLNQATFLAGDSLLFKRGAACSGMLFPQGSGTAEAPITIGAYGVGALPIIDGGGAEPAAIQLINQQGWHIENIETIGGSTYGIYIGNKDRNTLTHFRVTNVVVHDVKGNSTDKLDGLIYIGTDWFKDGIIQDVIVDGAAAYNTGHWNGIKIMCTGSMTYPETLPVIIRNSTVHTTGGDGIVIFSCSNGLIENNVAYNTGNVKTKDAGTPNSIWTWSCKDCTIQFNEAYLSHSPAVDGGAFDIDYPAENNTVQYNYGHDNDSYCVAVLGAANSGTINSTVRYNICSNNNQETDSPDGSSSRFGEFDLFTWEGGWLNGVAIYNNTVYWNPWDGAAWPAFCNGCIDGWPATFKGTRPNFFMNNIIYSTSPNLVFSLASGNMRLDNNIYWYTGEGDPMFAYGGEAYAEANRYTSFAAYQAGSGQDTHSQYINPLLNDPSSHAHGMPTTAFTLLPGSPAINTGADLVAQELVPDMGTRDFFGNPIPIGAYDIGAYESPLSSSALPQIAGARAVGLAAYNALRGGEPPVNLTCRSIQRVTASGPAIRIRLSNATGSAPLFLDQVYVGISTGGAETLSNTQAFFGGLPGITIPVGEQVYSDPLALPVNAGDDVAASVYMAGKTPEKWAAGWPEEISCSSYCTDWVDGGNHAASTSEAAYTKRVTGPQGSGPQLFLTAIDVYSSQPTGSVLVIGDSITAGTSALGTSGNKRWSDVLAERLRPSPDPKPVANLAIAGATCEMANDWAGALLPRIERDVISQSNVSHVILAIGTNDLARSVTTAQLQACLLKIRDQLHASGLKMIVSTIIPLTGSVNPERFAFNEWLRAKATIEFDGLVDFDLILRDPSNPESILPAYAADAIHPNQVGHAAIGKAIDLALFQQK